MVHTAVARPGTDEHLPYYTRYIEQVKGDDALEVLVALAETTPRFLAGITEAKSAHRYAPGKWSVKQTIGHLIDGERVFTYRALRIGRGDLTPLPGFDENEYVERGGFDERPFTDIALELRAVRSATIALFASLTPESLERRGKANDATITPRALAWIVAGHELHHLTILRERYGITEG